MANGTIHQFGTLYIDEEAEPMPSNPISGGEGGDCIDYYDSCKVYLAEAEMTIGDTVPGKELQWIEWTKPDGTKLFVCDRCLAMCISWDHLDDLGYIFGKEITIDGQKYRMRSLTGSDGREGNYGPGCENEWDQLLDAVGEDNTLLHWDYMHTWCQETDYNCSSFCSFRGSLTARNYNSYSATDLSPDVGFRPVLEILGSVANSAPSATGSKGGVVQQTITLRRLKELFDRGILTEKEFEKMATAIPPALDSGLRLPKVVVCAMLLLWEHGNQKTDTSICCNITLFLCVNTERNY